MYVFLLVLAVILFLALKHRETFVMKYGNPFNDEDIVSFNENASGTRLFGITPDSCPSNKPETDAGLCYEQCDMGYHGVGPVCWADSKNVGVGTIPDLKSRIKKVTSWGSVGCTGGRGFRFQGYNDCYTLDIPELYQECPDRDGEKTENFQGLCYKKCPEKLPNRIPGMPYLCFSGGRGLSYGRGVGDVPPMFSFGEK